MCNRTSPVSPSALQYTPIKSSLSLSTIIAPFLAAVILSGCGGGGASNKQTDDGSAPASDSPSVTQDGRAPTAPANLTVVAASPDIVTLSWSASRDNVGVVGYEISASDIQLGEVDETGVTVDGLSANTDYAFTVQAYDAAGNVSTASAPLVVKTPSADDANSILHTGFPRLGFPRFGGGGGGGGGGTAPVAGPDTAAPSIPTGLAASGVSANQATLSWTAATDNVGVATYEVFNGSQLMTLTTQPVAVLTGLAPSTNYSFAVQARDAAQNVSGLSAAVAVTTLAATTPTPSTPNTQGQLTYTQSCAVCHGADGQGTGQGTVAPIIGVTRAIPLAELTTLIDTTMPPGDPTLCTGACASSVAQYVSDTFMTQPGDGTEPVNFTEPLAGLAEGPEQIAALCNRLALLNRSDVVRDTFCGATPPAINSLRGLQTALGLTFNNPNATGRGNNGANGNPGFALTGHSSSLVARFVNAINPRAIIFTPANRFAGAPAGYVAMGFVRGDQFAEIAAADRNNNNAVNFYLVTFKQACNLTNTCTDGDLLTPAVESNWLDVTVYDDSDLRNTIFDCLQCHQVNGPGTQKILRMQELANPWSHWFRDNRASNVLLQDFQAAHGTNEDYAGIPANLISASDPAELEDLVRAAGFAPQPNQYNSGRIEAEVRQTAGQPADNTTPGVSATWNAIYQNSVQSQAIAVPYHDIKVTDPALLPNLIQSYRGFVNGTLSAQALPDIRDAFYQAQLRDIGFKVQAGLDGAGIVRQACGQCHNSRLDQTIGRARFNIDLAAMSDTRGGVLTGAARDAEIGLAVTRMLLPPEDVRKMPPEMFRTLDAAEINSAAAYLCSQTTTAVPQCAGR